MSNMKERDKICADMKAARRCNVCGVSLWHSRTRGYFCPTNSHEQRSTERDMVKRFRRFGGRA